MIDAKLDTLITLLEEKNYTKAANRLFITQPAVTHHIKMLEKEYDIVLFKNSKTLELTPSGKLLYEYAKNVKESNKLLISRISNQTNNIYNIGITNTALNVVLSRFFKVVNNQISYNLYCYNYDVLEYKLSAGELDFVIVDNSFDSQQFDSILLFSERVSIYASNKGIYHDMPKITRDDLAKASIVLPNVESGLYKKVTNYLSLKNIRLKNNIVFYSNSMDSIKLMMEFNDAISFLYDSSVTDYINNNELIKLELINFALSQNIYLLYNRSNFDNRTKILIDRIKKLGAL